MTAITHQPLRPSWDCDTCDRSWPCDSARERMVSEGAGVSLAIVMWGYLEDAVQELPSMPAAEVFDRFISWTRPTVLLPDITTELPR